MCNSMRLALGTIVLAVCVAAPAGVFAQDQTTPPAPAPSAQDQQNAQPVTPSAGLWHSTVPTPVITPYAEHIRWSSRYELTPLEQKRLQAMGLTQPEVFAVANAARHSGRDIDDVAQMVLRGETYWDIASDLGISYDSMFRVRPDWQTPEWQQAVKEGSPEWYGHASSTGTTGGGMQNEGGMR